MLKRGGLTDMNNTCVFNRGRESRQSQSVCRMAMHFLVGVPEGLDLQRPHVRAFDSSIGRKPDSVLQRALLKLDFENVGATGADSLECHRLYSAESHNCGL
jgi:hypothetical protein